MKNFFVPISEEFLAGIEWVPALRLSVGVDGVFELLFVGKQLAGNVSFVFVGSV